MLTRILSTNLTGLIVSNEVTPAGPPETLHKSPGLEIGNGRDR